MLVATSYSNHAVDHSDRHGESVVGCGQALVSFFVLFCLSHQFRSGATRYCLSYTSKLVTTIYYINGSRVHFISLWIYTQVISNLTDKRRKLLHTREGLSIWCSMLKKIINPSIVTFSHLSNHAHTYIHTYTHTDK